VVPVWWLYVQTANFTFWNVFAVTAQDDYFTHDCVDALRRLGVPHDRHSALYRLACGWWPKDFVKRTALVTAAWTLVFGGLPLIVFFATPPYHKEHCSKITFVTWVTVWSSSAGAALCTLVQARAHAAPCCMPRCLRCCAAALLRCCADAAPRVGRCARRGRGRAALSTCARTRGCARRAPFFSWRGAGAARRASWRRSQGRPAR
jgi:hypothetical protein